MKDRRIGRFARIEAELLEQAATADARALVADADADRAIFVMDAHGDDRLFEARVAMPGMASSSLPERKRGVSIATTMRFGAKGRKPCEQSIRRAYVAA